MDARKQQKGFSIIEVVLVLAIAGLIFLMVFIALPALQRGQRDSARQSEVGAVVGAIGTYASMNNGRTPSSAAQLAIIVNGKSASAADATELDSGAEVQIVSTSGNTVTLTPDVSADINSDRTIAFDEIAVFFGYKCGDTNGQLVSGTRRQAAVVTIQESGGSTGTVYCQNS
ncbi:type II secretion system protein [Candidatus Saccharibacteria bacterium]|nr:type II secretion system protein [Candidatus Saccharibacteria bacterium]